MKLWSRWESLTGDVDYSVTFGGQTENGSNVTVEAHYTFLL